MFKKLICITLIALLAANLTPCAPKQDSNVSGKTSSEKQTSVTLSSVEEIPSWEEYQNLPFNEAMEPLAVEECEKDAKEYLASCLKDDGNAELLSISFSKDELSVKKGMNNKPLENLFVDIDAKLLTSSDPDFKVMDKSYELIDAIDNHLRRYTYTAALTSRLRINIFYGEMGIVNSSDIHISSTNNKYFKHQPESELAAQTVAYDFTLKNEDFVLDKFGAIPETSELYIEYYIQDRYFLGTNDFKEKPNVSMVKPQTENLNNIHQEIIDSVLSSDKTHQYMEQHSLDSITISFQNGCLDEGYMTFHTEL